MPYQELEVVPNTFSCPAASSFTPYVREFQVRIPALPSPACAWESVLTNCTVRKPRTALETQGATSGWDYDTNHSFYNLYGYVFDYVPGSFVWYCQNGATLVPFPVSPGNIYYTFNTDVETAKWVTLYWIYTGTTTAEVSDLRFFLFWSNVCEPLPDGGDDGDDDDDDDDTPNGPGSGVYRAIKADSPRGWLHVANEAAIETKHIVPGTPAFASGIHGVKWWKQFDVDVRNGLLFALGRATGDAEISKVFVSEDGGLSVQEVLSVTANSTVMQYDSQNKWLIVLKEAEPPSPSDPLSNGVVSMQVSRNHGESFESPVTCEYAGGTLSARLLGMTYADREGAELFLLCRIGAQTKLLNSTDGGKKWEARIA